MSFQTLNLDAKLLRAIEASGYTTPTEIQSQAIPVALSGRDLMASAQTGTGKTAAFVLPALQRLISNAPRKGRGPRVLVLTPTRELAAQVLDAVKRYSKFAPLRVGAIVGGAPYPAQERMLRENLDILVATPGRLIDHMERGRVDFSRIELLILDEADRMLDMGFIEPVEQISKATPAERQTLLFSATLEGKVFGLAQRLLKDPARIQVARAQAQHAQITQRMHQADDVRHKRRLLDHILCSKELGQAIVFTATKRSADELAHSLSADGHACAALHGDMQQGARNRTVQRLRQGTVKVLVATDVAARGLDIKGVSHVINFDLPMVAEDYVHRIGRTGRAGAFGTAASLVGPQDWGKLAGIERLTGNRLERQVVPGLEPSVPESRASRPAPHRSKSRGNGQKTHKPAAGKAGFKPGFAKGRGGKTGHHFKSPASRPGGRSGNDRARA
ncbi:MAG: DEAD/DEAH box helicase [Gammaproteobacteria bacterium]|nr:DEAD/DEAH box helicase [Gammaproteobacteria bacterium]